MKKYQKYFVFLLILTSIMFTGCEFFNQLFGNLPVNEDNTFKITGDITLSSHIKVNANLYILKFNKLDDYNSQNIDISNYDTPLTVEAQGGYIYNYSFSNLVQDNYVIIAFLDVNGDKKLNFDSSGNPVEPVGFSKVDSGNLPVLEELDADKEYNFDLFSYYEEDIKEENDIITDATIINPGNYDTHNLKQLSFDCFNDINDLGDIDWFYFSASAGSTYEYYFKFIVNEGDINLSTVKLEIWEDETTKLDSTLISMDPLIIKFIPPSAKNYYLKIYDLNKNKGNYTLESWTQSND